MLPIEVTEYYTARGETLIRKKFIFPSTMAAIEDTTDEKKKQTEKAQSLIHFKPTEWTGGAGSNPMLVMETREELYQKLVEAEGVLPPDFLEKAEAAHAED